MPTAPLRHADRAPPPCRPRPSAMPTAPLRHADRAPAIPRAPSLIPRTESEESKVVIGNSRCECVTQGVLVSDAVGWRGTQSGEGRRVRLAQCDFRFLPTVGMRDRGAQAERPHARPPSFPLHSVIPAKAGIQERPFGGQVPLLPFRPPPSAIPPASLRHSRRPLRHSRESGNPGTRCANSARLHWPFTLSLSKTRRPRLSFLAPL